jgi:hypothetical protein
MFPLFGGRLRHPRRLLPLVILILLLASLPFGTGGSAAPLPAPDEPGPPSLFLDLPEAAPGAQPLPPTPSIATIRERLTGIDTALLTDPQRNQALQLNLFDGVTITAERTQAGMAYADGFVWAGRVPDKAFSAVTLVKVNDAVAGMVTDGIGQTYEIRSAGNGRYVLRQLDTTRFPDEAPSLSVPGGVLAEKPAAPAIAGPAAPAVDDSSRLDIMVVYSDDARAAAGGDSQMKAEVYLAVEVANQAYANSNIVQRLNLVYTSEIAYGETGNASTDLSRLQNSADGQIDQVPTLRDRYGADLVTFLVDSLDYCGIGYVMTTVSAAFAPYAYNVVDRECASASYSMAHELGHNMGGQHDWYADDSTAPYSYAHGFVDLTHHWRTVMAYSSECGAQTPAVSCPRIGYFSNPAVNYGGNPTGVTMGTNTSCTAGNLSNPDCDADMRTALNNTRATVAAFRNTAPGRSDAWMKDTWEDTGGEPDAYTAAQDMWTSPYLWVRNAQDTSLVHEHEHENPIDTVTNYVYAKLQNGSESSMAGTLRLYWAEAAAGLSWPADWHNFANVAATLSANSSKVVEATWVPSGTGHYCLLARWDSAADPMHAEGAGISANVRNNNNIIWKNVQVLPYTPPDCEKEQMVPVIVRNVGDLAGNKVDQLDLLFRPAIGTADDWLKFFDYVQVAPGNLMDRWQSMDDFERVSDTRLQLVNGKGGALRGLGMQDREEQTIRLFMKPSCKNFPSTPTNFGIEVVQVAKGDRAPVGGVSYLVTLQPLPSAVIVVTGSKFNDRNKNGMWDEDGSEPPLAGWQIVADNLKGDQHFTAVTNAAGRYRLELPRDIYRIYEVVQDGWTQTTPAGGTYELDLREVALNSTMLELNFGNYQERPLGDLGDAPDNTNHFGAVMMAYPGVQARYPTVYGDPPAGTTRGPLHLKPRALAWLGKYVSLEWDADQRPDEDVITNLAPPANRPNRDLYDDGVRPALMTLPNCATTTFKYDVNVLAPGIQRWYTNVWMDFNRDGDWQDSFQCQSATGQVLTVSEWAVQNQVVTLAAGYQTVVTPAFVAARPATPNDPLWMRITLAEQTAPDPRDGSGPAGGYQYGETEDYLLGRTAVQPNLGIRSEANDRFFYGNKALYLLHVTNNGQEAAPAPVNLYDELPPGLALLSAAGQGWSCVLEYQAVACEYAGGIPAGAEAPPLQLALQVDLPSADPLTEAHNCTGVQVDGDVDETNNTLCTTTRLTTKPPPASYLPMINRAP